MEKNDIEYMIMSVILGHAVADALGVPWEFASRQELDAAPIEDMEGYGTYPYPAGTWSDDTSMTLCALDSLAKCRVDPNDIMKKFGLWLQKNEYTPTGECFDVGGTCFRAILSYLEHGTPAIVCGGKDENSCGNGSLMRILPFVLYCTYSDPDDEMLDVIHDASALTHAHDRSKVGCGIYALIMQELLYQPDVSSVYQGIEKAKNEYKGHPELKHYRRIFNIGFEHTRRDDIKSSGYVVDTLEAAIWCVLTTDNYRECVLKAVNLGEDTDTVAAVAGGMAGAIYGLDGIPEEWLNTLLKREYIEELCHNAYIAWCSEE